MLLKAATLQKISTKDLITITVAQNSLENNFQIILEALEGNSGMLEKHEERLNNLEKMMKENADNQLQFKLKSEEVQKDLRMGQDKHSDKLSVLEQKIRQISIALGDVVKVNPETEKQQEEMFKTIRVLKQKMDEAQGKIETIETKTAILDGLAQKVKDEEQKMVKVEQEIQKLTDEIMALSRARSANGHSLDDLMNRLNQIDVIQADFLKLSGQLRGDLATIKDNDIINIKDKLDDLDKKGKLISDQVWKLNDDLFNNDKHNRQFQKEAKVSLQDLFKKLQDLQELLYKFKSEPSTNRGDSSSLSPEKEEEAAMFKKQIIDKLKQQRTDFNKAIKRLDYATNKNNEETDKYSQLEDTLLKLGHLLDGKVDNEGNKKWMKYVQNKLNALYRIVSADSTEEDAYLARKNWFCLSCDRKLSPYRGKLGQHISTHLKAKLPEQEVIGGGMLFRTKSKYELSQLKK